VFTTRADAQPLGAANAFPLCRFQELSMTSHRPLTSLRGIISSAVALTLALALAGCQNSQKKEETTAPPSVERAAELRETLKKAHPNALVGQVIAVHDTKPYAAIGDLPVQDAKVGQTVVFVDSNGLPYNAGTLVAIYGDTVHVQFETGKRPPQKGDLAMVMKE
jgi:hypothetical protein